MSLFIIISRCVYALWRLFVVEFEFRIISLISVFKVVDASALEGPCVVCFTDLIDEEDFEEEDERGEDENGPTQCQEVPDSQVC
jgi:hypothetical protein